MGKKATNEQKKENVRGKVIKMTKKEDKGSLKGEKKVKKFNIVIL